jgi:hypothetical protein
LNVEQNQARACFFRDPNCLVGIARFPDDLVAASRFQNSPQPRAKDRMIVDQQHSPC